MSDKQAAPNIFTVDPAKIKEARTRLKEFPTYMQGLEAAKKMGIDTSDILDKLNWAKNATETFLKVYDPDFKEEKK
jgi:hypothetical protein